MAVTAEVTAFLEDLGDNLTIIDSALASLEEDSQNQEFLRDIFRAAHTIKGNAAMMDLTDLVALGHALETALQEVLQGVVGVNSVVLNLFHECRVGMVQIAEALRSGKNTQHIEIRPLTDKIQVLLLTGPRGAPVVESAERQLAVTVFISQSEQVPSVRAFLVENRLNEWGKVLSKTPTDEELESPAFSASERKLTYVLQTESSASTVKENLNIDQIERISVIDTGHSVATHSPLETTKGEARVDVSASSDTIRLSVTTLDKLLNLTGELVIANSALEQLSTDFSRSSTDADLAIKLRDKTNDLFRVAADIQNIVMKSRMLPLDYVFSRFKRFVREYADKSGKLIRLEVSGADTELDKRVIDEIVKPLTHLIRNALDHGIEESEERVRQGKESEGTLHLSAAQAGSSILISVEDDGKGIDTQKVLEHALSKQLITPERAQNVTREEIYEFIFMPGFSTKEVADDLSGRGFGMDIVRESIKKLSGDLQVSSVAGKGTRMVIKLPLTLAILTALTVRVRTDLFAFPLAVIEETINAPTGNVVRLDGQEVLHWRDQILPFIKLDHILGYPPIEDIEEEFLSAILVEVNRMRFAIGVDEFLRKQELVIKSLGEHYKQVRGLSGASMLGDNEIVFIVDVEEIANMYGKKQVGASKKKTEGEGRENTALADVAADSSVNTTETADENSTTLKPAEEEKVEPQESVADTAHEAVLPQTDAVVATETEEPMKPIFDFSDVELMRKWIAQSNKTAVQGIQMLTGNPTITVKKSRGARIQAEKARTTADKLVSRAGKILLIHLPMLPAAGAIDLIMTRRAAERMAKLLFSAAGFDAGDEFDPSPLLEITNILGSAYTNTLTFLTEKSVEPATPTLFSTPEAIKELFDARAKTPHGEMLIVENQFRIDDEDIEVEIMIYLEGD